MKSYNPVAVMLILINHLDNKTLYKGTSEAT